MSKNILVTGATGKQGSSVITSLLESNSQSPKFKIFALTRNPTSPSAQSLSSKPNVELVHGDLDHPKEIFEQIAKKGGEDGKVWGVFSVQTSVGKGQSVEKEEKHGKALVDAAKEAGVKQFVYSSVDRGGQEKDLGIPHLDNKLRIENHLKANAGGMNWTILRPVFFMENFTKDFFGKVLGAALHVGVPEPIRLQMVATKDIGHFARLAFEDPEGYSHQSVGLAGDSLTVSEQDATFKKVTGHPTPRTFSFLGSLAMMTSKEIGSMFRFFKGIGFSVDIEELRKRHNGLVGFEEWLRTEYGR